MALDKTGTVTLGRLEVVDVQNVDGEPDGLVCRAAAVEQFSEHPLARAINLACPRPPTATGFKADPGLGVSAVLDDGATVRVGRRRVHARASHAGGVRSCSHAGVKG